MQTRGAYLTKLLRHKTCRVPRVPDILRARIRLRATSSPQIHGVQYLRVVENDPALTELKLSVIKSTPSFKKVVKESVVTFKKVGDVWKMGDYVVHNE